MIVPGIDSGETSFADSSATFPQKLYALMEFEEGDVVHWAPHGFAFVVTDQEKFLDEIVPRYFKHTKLTSFQRQLNLYGFRRLTKGEDQGAYFHPRFQRGRKDLIPEIKRLPAKGSLPTLEQVMNACKQLPSERFGGFKGKKGSFRAGPGASSSSGPLPPSGVANSGGYLAGKYPHQMGMYGAPGMNPAVAGANSAAMMGYNGFNPYMMGYSNFAQMNPYFPYMPSNTIGNSTNAATTVPGVTSSTGTGSNGDGVDSSSSSSGGNEFLSGNQIPTVPVTKSKLTMNIGFSNGQMHPSTQRMGAAATPYSYQQSGSQEAAAAAFAHQYRMGWQMPVSSNFSTELPSNSAADSNSTDGAIDPRVAYSMYPQSFGFDPSTAAAAGYYYQQPTTAHSSSSSSGEQTNGESDDKDLKIGPTHNFEEIDKLGILEVFAPENVDSSLGLDSDIAVASGSGRTVVNRMGGCVPSFDDAMDAQLRSLRSPKT